MGAGGIVGVEALCFLSITTVVVVTSTVNATELPLESLKVKMHWPAPCAVTVSVSVGPEPLVGDTVATEPDVFPLPVVQFVPVNESVPV